MDKNTTTTEPIARFRVEGRQALEVYQWVDAESPEEAMRIARLQPDSWDIVLGDQYEAPVTGVEVTEEEEL